MDFSEALPGMKLVGAALKQKYLSSGGCPLDSFAPNALVEQLVEDWTEGPILVTL